MSYVINSLALPIHPARIKSTNTAQITEAIKAGDYAILIGFGKKAKQIAMHGWLVKEGYTNAQIETSFLIPIDNSTCKKVNFYGPNSRYDGSYIVDKFEYEEKGVVGFEYDLILKKGGLVVVVG